MNRVRQQPQIFLYWATLLDNVIAGYDPQAKKFSKAKLPYLKFQDRCYFVTRRELPLGIAKAKKIADAVKKQTGIAPRICVLETTVHPAEVLANETGGFGVYIPGNSFFVSRIFLAHGGNLQPVLYENLVKQQKENLEKEES